MKLTEKHITDAVSVLPFGSHINRVLMKLTEKQIVAGLFSILSFLPMSRANRRNRLKDDAFREDFFFMGYRNTVTVEGIVTSEISVNFLGIIFALIALAMVGSQWADISQDHADDKYFHRAILAGIALLAICQLIYSIDLIP